MKTATTAIMDILSACGCNPAAMTDGNGDTIIKVNAPPANDPAPMNFNDPWIAFFEPD